MTDVIDKFLHLEFRCKLFSFMVSFCNIPKRLYKFGLLFYVYINVKTAVNNFIYILNIEKK